MAKRSSDSVRHTTVKLRIYPTEHQAALFEKTFGCCRYLWNQMLSDQEEFYSATGIHYLPTPARYKKDAPFLKEVDSQALVSVHQNLRRAFQKFFENPSAYRHPVFKKKKRGHEAYTIYKLTQSENIYLTDKAIRLPKAGLVRTKFHRRPLHWWRLRTATVSRTPSGKYFCSLLYEYPVKTAKPARPTPETTLGLTYSVPHFYVDSQGYQADPPRWLAESGEKLKRLQRRLARMERGSGNYEKQLHKIQRLHEHIANQRKDFIHKESRRIANAWDAVCLKDTDLVELARRLPMGNVMASGFGLFRTALAYKLAEQGKPCILVDRFYPAARTCRACGAIHDALTLKDRIWSCPVCGEVHTREVNAARNIRDQGYAALEAAA